VRSMNAAGTVLRLQRNSGSAGGHCIEDLESCNFPTDPSGGTTARKLQMDKRSRTGLDWKSQ
jgi:hypothetical protein